MEKYAFIIVSIWISIILSINCDTFTYIMQNISPVKYGVAK